MSARSYQILLLAILIGPLSLEIQYVKAIGIESHLLVDYPLVFVSFYSNLNLVNGQDLTTQSSPDAPETNLANIRES